MSDEDRDVDIESDVCLRQKVDLINGSGYCVVFADAEALFLLQEDDDESGASGGYMTLVRFLIYNVCERENNEW